MTNVFLTFLGISATVGAAVLLIQLISPSINRRYAAKWKYLIWIFLAVRLLVPVSGIYQKKQPEEKPTESLPSQTQTSPAESDGETIYVQQPQRFVVEIPVQAVEKIATQPQKSRPAVSLLDAAVMLWLAGAAAFAGVHIVSYVLCTRRIKRHGKIITEGGVYELMQSLRTELGVRSKIALVRYPEASSPMIIGFVKPLLVLPDDTIDDSELYFIIRHELIHQKRHDVYAKLLSVLANAVHWFNPIIWLMRREIAIDMELSCDEGVVRGADFGTKRAYTETLMSSLSRQTLQRSSLTTQFYGGKSTMKKRFANILNDRKKRSGIVLLILTVMLTTMLGALVGCTQKVSLPSDSELGQMIYKYLEYESYAGYDNPTVDFERPYSDDPEDAGYWSYPVIEEGLTTWQDWLDYLGGIFTEKGVEAALKQTEDRYVNYDDNLYYRDGGMGWTLSGTFSIARVEQTADKAFTVEFWREYDPSFTDGDAREFLITVLDFEYTRDGWRIADHSDRDSTPEDSHPNLTEFKPFGDSADRHVGKRITETSFENRTISLTLPEGWNYLTISNSEIFDLQHTGIQLFDGEIPEQREMYDGKLYIAIAASGFAKSHVDSWVDMGKEFTEEAHITSAGDDMKLYYVDGLPEYATFDYYSEMCVFFDLNENDDLDVIFGIIDSISFEDETYVRLTEQRVSELVEEYVQFSKYVSANGLSRESDDSDSKILVDGNNFYPVTEEGLTTYQEWSDYLHSFMTDECAENCLGQHSYDKRYINHDGKLYVNESLSTAYNLSDPIQTAFRPNLREAEVEFWRESLKNPGEYVLVAMNLKLINSEWKIDSYNNHSDHDGYTPIFGRPSGGPLTDEKVKSLVRNYLLYERFTSYDSLNYSTSNPDDRVLLGDDYYYPVTEDGLTTYQEWNDFVRGIFTDEVADEYLKQQFEEEKRYANIDGKLYTLDAGGMGWYLYNPCQVGYKEIDSGAVVEFWQEYFDEGSEGTYRVTVFNLKLTESGWKIESCNCYESYSDYDGYTPMLEKPSNSSSLSDEEMNRLLSEYLRFDSYTNSGMIKVDWQDTERRITKNGFDYCPSAEEGLTTWQEWSDFLNGIFDSDLADTWLKLYSEGIMRYIDIDGKLYTRDWAMGVHYGEPCQTGSKMYSSWAEIEYWQEALFEGEAGNYLITVLTVELTDTGWKITNTESHVYPGSDGFVPMLEKPTESTQPSNNDDSAESIEAVPTIVNNESESLAEIPGISELIDEQFKDYIVYGGMYYTNVSEEPSWSATDFAVGEKLMEINEISSNRHLAELKDGTSSLLAVGTEIFKCENRLEILLARAGDTYVPYCKMVEG